MPRPPKFRRVEFMPETTLFIPQGKQEGEAAEVVLTVEELEAIRLKDFEGLEQEESAAKMAVSRPTFQRVLMTARSKIAEALTAGKAIRIEGGNYHLAMRSFRCRSCDHEFEVPFGSGQRGLDLNCPRCHQQNVHRIDQNGHGFGRQPWGRHRGGGPRQR